MTFRDSVSNIVEANENGLLSAHASWERIPLCEVCTILNGYPFASAQFSATEGFPLLRIRDVRSSTTETRFRGEYDEVYVVRPADLLIGMDGDFNCAAWRGPPALLNQRVCKVSPDEGHYNKAFLGYVLQGYLSAINANTPATTVKHLSSKTVAEIPLPLPPLPEQARIGDFLASYFTRLDDAVATLERVQRNLKRYRASVLKAAVEGRLVPTEAELARAEKRDYEPASEFLERILAERRRRWNRKGKYEEPAPPDTSNLPELPEGWCWATVLQLFATVTDGDHLPPPQTDSGVPFLVIGNVRDGAIDLSDTRFVSKEYYANLDDSRRPQRGDVLYTVTGSFGIPVLVRTDQPFCVQRHIAILRPLNITNAAFVCRILETPLVFKQATSIATGTAQKTVPLKGLRQIVVPLPPEAEQARILLALDRHLSIIQDNQRALDAARLRCTRLRQSILKWAFEGKLVDQDPDDEPASALLERIRAERSGTPEKKTPARRGRQTARNA